MDGTAAIGSSTKWAKADHVHPSDTSKLSLAGGTLTGNLNGTTATFSGAVSTNDLTVVMDASNLTVVGFNDNIGNNRANIYFAHASGTLGIGNNPASTSLLVDGSGNFNYSGGTGVASKIGGGSWTAASDARIKTVEGDYASGLEQVMALAPVLYRYKGNDAAAKGEASPHAKVASDQTQFVGLIAQSVEPVMPEMVKRTSGVIDGVEVDDLRTLDTTPLIFALVNAVKTLAARVAEPHTVILRRLLLLSRSRATRPILSTISTEASAIVSHPRRFHSLRHYP